MNIQRHNSYATIRIDKQDSYPDFNDSLATVDWITFEKESGKALTMQMTLGRLYQYGVEREWYGQRIGRSIRKKTNN